MTMNLWEAWLMLRTRRLYFKNSGARTPWHHPIIESKRRLWPWMKGKAMNGIATTLEGMTTMKKTLLFALTPLLVSLLLLCFCNVGQASAATYADEPVDTAISWCKKQVGKSIEVNDSRYKYQCVDFAMAYYRELGAGYFTGNAKDYATASKACPSGWKRIAGAKPQKGDILVYKGNKSNPYGHVAVYESDYVTYHQNFNNVKKVQKVTNVKYNKFSNPYWGVVRPLWPTKNLSNSSTSIASYTYTGKDIKPGLTLRYGNATLKLNSDYTVKYSNCKNTGRATVTVYGKGQCYGSKSFSFKITPQKMAKPGLKASKNSITVTWKKAAGNVNAYTVKYAEVTKKGTSAWKTVNLKNSGNKTSYTISGLKSNTTYQVMVKARTYINESDIAEGVWSSSAQIKTPMALSLSL